MCVCVIQKTLDTIGGRGFFFFFYLIVFTYCIQFRRQDSHIHGGSELWVWLTDNNKGGKKKEKAVDKATYTFVTEPTRERGERGFGTYKGSAMLLKLVITNLYNQK